MQKFITQLHSQADEYAGRYNLKVYDITMRNERGGRILRINLDGDVDLDSCAEISRQVSVWLDENEELIPYDKYTLEVSSLGVDRPLKSYEDFASRTGKLCRVTTKEKDRAGRKRYKGRITEVTPEYVKIYTEEENAYFTIAFDAIARANIEFEF